MKSPVSNRSLPAIAIIGFLTTSATLVIRDEDVQVPREELRAFTAQSVRVLTALESLHGVTWRLDNLSETERVEVEWLNEERAALDEEYSRLEEVASSLNSERSRLNYDSDNLEVEKKPLQVEKSRLDEEVAAIIRGYNAATNLLEAHRANPPDLESESDVAAWNAEAKRLWNEHARWVYRGRDKQKEIDVWERKWKNCQATEASLASRSRMLDQRRATFEDDKATFVSRCVASADRAQRLAIVVETTEAPQGEVVTLPPKDDDQTQREKEQKKQHDWQVIKSNATNHTDYIFNVASARDWNGNEPSQALAQAGEFIATSLYDDVEVARKLKRLGGLGRRSAEAAAAIPMRALFVLEVGDAWEEAATKEVTHRLSMQGKYAAALKRLREEEHIGPDHPDYVVLKDGVELMGSEMPRSSAGFLLKGATVDPFAPLKTALLGKAAKYVAKGLADVAPPLLRSAGIGNLRRSVKNALSKDGWKRVLDLESGALESGVANMAERSSGVVARQLAETKELNARSKNGSH